MLTSNRENEYILTGYRAPSNSWVKSVRSILGIHNETINIWSHIVGCILFLTIPIYVFTTEIPPRYKVATTEDIIVCTTYFIGVAICFFLSSAYHTLANHSSSWHFFTVQLDYLGILILMYSAHIPLIYYGFVCDHGLRNMYWGITSFLALLCAYSTLRPGFADVQAKMWRAAFYTAFGASSFAPIIHAVVKYGWEVQNQRMGLTWWALVAVFNLIGVVTYGLKMPEKFFPGRFDIVGQSHQIMHISVVVAGMMHVMGCLGDFDYLHEHGAQCS
ncbi:hemolysin-III channel protein-like protein Izh2 [Sarocladium strictum]